MGENATDSLIREDDLVVAVLVSQRLLSCSNLSDAPPSTVLGSRRSSPHTGTREGESSLEWSRRNLAQVARRLITGDTTVRDKQP